MRRRGFTIVELMVVVGIIAVLLTIVVSSVTGTLRQARSERAQALCTLVEQGLSTYYAQKGEWPWGEPRETADYYLNSGEIKDAIFQLVKESKQGNPMMDISGLFVCPHDGDENSRYYGMDFMTAVRGSKEHPRKLKAGELYYGYPDKETGYFRRFKILYSPITDRVKVSRQ